MFEGFWLRGDRWREGFVMLKKEYDWNWAVLSGSMGDEEVVVVEEMLFEVACDCTVGVACNEALADEVFKGEEEIIPSSGVFISIPL